MFTAGHADSRRRTHEPGTDRIRLDRRLQLGYVALKRVPEPVNRPHVIHLLRVVANRVAHLRDEGRQAGIRDERPCPEVVVNLGFRNGRRPPAEEQCQEIERLRGQMDAATRPPDLAGFAIDLDVAKTHPYRGAYLEGATNAAAASCWPADFVWPSTINCPHAARMSRPRLLRTDTVR